MNYLIYDESPNFRYIDFTLKCFLLEVLQIYKGETERHFGFLLLSTWNYYKTKIFYFSSLYGGDYIFL